MSKISKRIKSTTLTILATGLGFGSPAFSQNKTGNNNGKSKTNTTQVAQKNQQKVQLKTEIITINKNNKPVTPEESAILYTFIETYRKKPVRQPGENVYTYGPGVTWDYYDTAKTKLIRAYASKSGYKVVQFKTRTMDELYKIAYEHDQTKIKLNITQTDIKVKGINVENIKRALIIVGIQRPVDVAKIEVAVKKATTKQQIADAFLTGIDKVPQKFRNGTKVRRYACALIAIGELELADMLLSRPDSFTKALPLSQLMNNARTSFKINPGLAMLYRDKMKAGTGQGSVKDWLKNFKMGLTAIKEYDKGQPTRKLVAPDPKNKDDVIAYNLVKGLEQYNAGKYAEAEKFYNEVLKKDSNNAEAISDLSLVYYKIGGQKLSEGKTADAIASFKKSVSMAIKAASALDKESDGWFIAASYFNAGMSSQAIAEIYERQKEMAKAIKEYENAETNYGDAYKYNKNDIYKNRKNKMTEKLKQLRPAPDKKETQKTEPAGNQTLLDKAEDWHKKGQTQTIVESLTGKIANSGLHPKIRARLWFILGDALEKEAKKQNKPHYYRQAYNAYKAVKETYPSSSDIKAAKERANNLVKEGLVKEKLLTKASHKLLNEMMAQQYGNNTFDATEFILGQGRVRQG